MPFPTLSANSKRRAMTQAGANTESAKAVVKATYADPATGNITAADVLVKGQVNALVRVPNVSGYKLTVGDSVEMRCVNGNKHLRQIVGASGSTTAATAAAGASPPATILSPGQMAGALTGHPLLLQSADASIPGGYVETPGANVVFQDTPGSADGYVAGTRVVSAPAIVLTALPNPLTTTLPHGTKVDLVDSYGGSLGLYRLDAQAHVWRRRDVGGSGTGPVLGSSGGVTLVSSLPTPTSSLRPGLFQKDGGGVSDDQLWAVVRRSDGSYQMGQISFSEYISASYGSLPNTNQILFLEADNIVGVSNGATVNDWTDKSAAASNFSHTGDSVGSAPTFLTSALNSLPAVRYNGSNQRLLGPGSPFAPNLNTAGWTVWMLLRFTSAPSGLQSLFTSYSSPSAGFDFRSNGGTIEVGSPINNGAFSYSGGTLASGVWTLLEFRYDGATLTVKKNGATAGTYSSTQTFASNLNKVAIASFGPSSGNGDLGRYAPIDVAAIAVYSAAQSSTDESTTKTYFSGKYNLGF